MLALLPIIIGFPGRNGRKNHQFFGANPRAIGAINAVDGSLACWGTSSLGANADCPSDSGYTALFGSQLGMCAIKSDGS